MFNDPFAGEDFLRGCGDPGCGNTVEEQQQPMVSNNYMSQFGYRVIVPAATMAPLGGMDMKCE